MDNEQPVSPHLSTLHTCGLTPAMSQKPSLPHLGLARSQIQLFSTTLGPSLTTPPTETPITLLFPFPYAPFWGRRGKHYCYINYFIYIKSG